MRTYYWSLPIADAKALLQEINTYLPVIGDNGSQVRAQKHGFTPVVNGVQWPQHLVAIAEFTPCGSAVVEMSTYLAKPVADYLKCEPGEFGVIVTCAGFPADSEDCMTLERKLHALQRKYQPQRG